MSTSRLSLIATLLTFAVSIPTHAQLNDAEAKTVTPDNPTTTTSQSFPAKLPILPPKWAFGVLFGTYFDQPKLLDAAQKLRNGYCGDLLWIDSSWLSGDYTDKGQNHYINFTFDPQQFPDPKTMIATLRENHFHFGVWQWPFIEKSITELYAHGEQNHLFVTDQKGGTGKVVNGGGWHGVKFSGQFDFTNPAATQWYVELNKPLTDMGLDFLKIDTYSTVPKGGVTFDGSGSDLLRLGYHKAAYEVTQGGDPRKRGFYLAHHNPTPDNNQYPGMWTGDIKTSWAGFENDMKIAAKLNTPDTAAYWCSDTGGYNGDVPPEQGDELYIRWLQYGTFCPINEFFSSKGAKGRFPWLFGPDAQRNFTFYTQLRYKLLPFRYSNAQAAYHETPVQYPVRFVDGTQDEILVGHGDSELLVAPIHAEHATSREVKFPAGDNPWIDYWTDQQLDPDTTTATADAPLDRVPLFVKAGSIIPMGPAMQYVDEKIADPLALDIHPYADSAYTLYEDDGKTTDYQLGKFSRTPITCGSSPAGCRIDIGPTTGEYIGKSAKRTYILQVHSPHTFIVHREKAEFPQQDSREAYDAAAEGSFSDGKIIWVKFETPTDKPVSIVITYTN